MRGRAIFRALRQIMVPCQTAKYSSSISSEGTSGADPVLFREVESKCVITLNRPKVLNSLNLPMIHALTDKLKEYEGNPLKKLVILKGAGEKAFCAGGDVVAVRQSGLGDGVIARKFFFDEYKLNHLIGTFELPFVALIDGVTMGGGVGLSVHGKFRVATEKTLFAMPETAIGLFPDVGGGYFLPRLRGHLGYYLALTGHRLRGRDVMEAGIATHFIKSDKLDQLEEELLTMRDDPTKENVKNILDRYHQESSETHEFIWTPYEDAINSHFTAKTIEEIMANLKNDGSEWALKQVDIMSKMSPTSMKVTLRQLHEGATMNFKEVFTMEYRLAQHFVEDKKDFYEGVRAVLVDKCGNPKWDPPTIEDVTDEKLDWYFSPLPEDRELVILN